jgi:hypothetical protein
LAAGIMAGRLMEAAVEGAEGGAVADAKPASKKSEVEKVKMADGREVDFVGKRKMLKESTFPENETPIVRLDFRNGKTLTYQIPPELYAEHAAHGAEQKLGDETAGCDDVDDMYLAVEELIKRLTKRNEDGSFAGAWNVKREGGSMSGTSLLLKALVELSGKSEEQVKEFLGKMSPQEKTALRSSAKVKPIIDRLEAEKVKGKVDTDALLSQLA